MDDHAIGELLVEVRAGRLARRSFIQAMAGLGLVGPLATQLLATVGGAPNPDRYYPFCTDYHDYQSGSTDTCEAGLFVGRSGNDTTGGGLYIGKSARRC